MSNNLGRGDNHRWAVDGGKGNLWQSAVGGAIGGASTTLFNLGMFGAARPFDDSYIPHGSNRPVHRGGGLATFLGGTGIAWGRTAYVNSIDGSDGERIHESYHYYQQNKMGFANFYGRTISEYLRAFSLTGDWTNVYRTQGTLEYETMKVQGNYQGGRPFYPY